MEVKFKRISGIVNGKCSNEMFDHGIGNLNIIRSDIEIQQTISHRMECKVLVRGGIDYPFKDNEPSTKQKLPVLVGPSFLHR